VKENIPCIIAVVYNFPTFTARDTIMGKTKKSNTRKNKTKSLTFKLSKRQYQSFQNYCQLNATSPIKVIKLRIHDCIEEYSNEQIGKVRVPKNQLNLFHPLNKEEEQLELFD